MANLKLKQFLFLWVVVAFATGCAGATSPLVPTPTPESTTYWPTGDWRISTPEEQGMDSELLAQMIEYIEKEDTHIHSVLVVRNGYIVTEAYFYPFQPGSKRSIQACTKSFTSVLVGIAIDKGYIDGVNQRVLDFFPDQAVANSDPLKDAIALKHLLSMTSGLDWTEQWIPYNHPQNYNTQMEQSEDWVQFVLDRPMVEEPGTVFNYNSGGSHLLSAIVQQTTGMSTLAFAQTHLFEPLGISDIVWDIDSDGITVGGNGLHMTPRDMAKLGYLYLNGGVWDGRQIVSSDWVAASVSTQAENAWGPDYGYQWWIYRESNIPVWRELASYHLFSHQRATSQMAYRWGQENSNGRSFAAETDSLLSPFNAYAAVGYGGQYIFVVPNLDIVAVFAGGHAKETPVSLARHLIAVAAQSSEPLPENPRGVTLLESLSEEVEQQPEPQPVPSLPAIAQGVSGKRYALEANIYDWQSFVLSFRGQEASIHLVFGDDAQELPIGLDDVFRITQVDQFGPLYDSVALKGAWQDEDTFLLHLQCLNGPHGFDVSFDFDIDRVSVRVRGFDEYEWIRGTLQD
jgi:CubicO group peptidase (beta-lactamase class C family)